MYALLAGTISFDPNLRPELLAGRDVLDVVGPILDHTSVLLPGARYESSMWVHRKARIACQIDDFIDSGRCPGRRGRATHASTRSRDREYYFGK